MLGPRLALEGLGTPASGARKDKIKRTYTLIVIHLSFRTLLESLDWLKNKGEFLALRLSLAAQAAS
jgi:hypothetical protein